MKDNSAVMLDRLNADLAKEGQDAIVLCKEERSLRELVEEFSKELEEDPFGLLYGLGMDWDEEEAEEPEERGEAEEPEEAGEPEEPGEPEETEGEEPEDE